MASSATNGNADTSTNEVEKGDYKAPGWLKAELFEEMLKRNVENYKKIRNFKAKPGLAPGENFLTVMLRLEIDVELNDGQSRILSYMMKLPQESEIFQQLMRAFNVFIGEYKIYTEILPDFEQMYRNAGVEVKFGAQFYDVKTPAEFGVIVLEDLRPAGFKNANRLVGLDMEHIRCVLQKIAQFHAASAVRFETKGSYGEVFEVALYMESQREQLKYGHELTGKCILDILPTYKGHEIYEDAVRKLQNDIIEQILQAARIDANEFNVLNHGDCWVNNFMFQYDAAGNVSETMLVDFQLSKYGSPALDLYYFLLSSAQLELKLQQFDYFIRYYHDNLVKSLTLLKYPKAIPKLRDLHMQLYKYGFWGYYTIERVLAFVLCDPNENASVENFVSENATGNEFRQLLYTNPRFTKHMEGILPWLYYRGALDC